MLESRFRDTVNIFYFVGILTFPRVFHFTIFLTTEDGLKCLLSLFMYLLLWSLHLSLFLDLFVYVCHFGFYFDFLKEIFLHYCKMKYKMYVL